MRGNEKYLYERTSKTPSTYKAFKFYYIDGHIVPQKRPFAIVTRNQHKNICGEWTATLYANGVKVEAQGRGRDEAIDKALASIGE